MVQDVVAFQELPKCTLGLVPALHQSRIITLLVGARYKSVLLTDTGRGQAKKYTLFDHFSLLNIWYALEFSLENMKPLETGKTTVNKSPSLDDFVRRSSEAKKVVN